MISSIAGSISASLRDLDVDVDHVGAAEDDSGEDRQGDEDPVVEILVGERPSAGLHADDLELAVPHPHRLPDRVLAREERSGRVEAQHDDAPPEADVGG